MKKFLSLCLTAMLAVAFFVPQQNAKAVAGLEVDTELTQVLGDLTSNALVEAVVTYDSLPSSSDVSALKNLGLETKTFSKLPMVAV